MNSVTLLQPFFPYVSIPQTEISAITQSAQTATEGSVFVCIKGTKVDGHDFAPQAYRNGCRMFVAEHALSLPSDATVLQTEHSRLLLARLACAFYDHPSKKMCVIGITGTKGKTTTAQLLTQILNQNHIPCGYIGTNGIAYAHIRQTTVNTTPDPLILQKAMADMYTAGMRAVCIEVSSQALMQNRVDGISFFAAVFTNLYRDHIGTTEHPSLTHYREAKHRLFTDFRIPNVVWNADDQNTKHMRKGCIAEQEIFCSCIPNPHADYTAQMIRPYRIENTAGVSFSLGCRGQTTPCSLPLIGTYNVTNALLACAVAIEGFSLSPHNVITALKTASVDGRSEWISLPHGGTVVIDYAHNGESLKQTLTTLREYTTGRLLCLFGSVGERTQLRRTELGQVAAAFADLCIITSDNPGNEPPEQILEDIAKAFPGTHTPYLKIVDRAEAIRTAIRMVRSDDILLLAGKGHETYQLIGSEKRPFSERQIVESEMYSSASPIPI